MRAATSSRRFTGAVALATTICITAIFTVGSYSGTSSGSTVAADPMERAMQELAQDSSACFIEHFPPVECE